MKFFENPDVHLIFKITETMSLKDMVSFLAVNKALQTKSNQVLAKKMAVETIEEFYERYHKLDQYPLVQDGIKYGNLTIPTAEEIVSLFSLSNDEKIARVLQISPEKAVQIHPKILEYSTSDNGILALREKLITIEQASKLGYLRIQHLLTDHGIVALREKLITIEQAIKMNGKQIKYLTQDNGILALREKLITIEQAIKMYYLDMKYLTTDNGILALREELITIEQASKMSSQYTKLLTSDNGIFALREKLITIEQAKRMSFDKLEGALKNLIKSDQHQNRL